MEIDLIIVGLLDLLRREYYSEGTIEIYVAFWNKLKEFLVRVYGDTVFTIDRGLAYLDERCNFSTWYESGKLPQQRVQYLRMVHLLEDYALHGVLTRRYCSSKNPIVLREEYLTVHSSFLLHLKSTSLAKSTKNHYESISKMFLHFLTQKQILISELKLTDCDDYIRTLAGFSFKSIEQIVCGIRYFLRFLDETCILKNHYADKIHMPKVSQHAKIPAVWSKEDLKKLLATIDRNSPIGKRDYAIILLACTMGLRSIDIKNLKVSDFDWQKKQLSIIQHKTKNPLTLPVPDATGWAVIDYIKNGRPKCSSVKTIFVKHMPPFDSVSDSNHLAGMIKRYMNKAGIKVDHKSGLHSMRHTAASMMLEEGTALPVITEVLGHSNSDVTAIYLKTQREKLQECVLSPDFLLEGDYGISIE